MKVSIIVPIYNAAKHLDACLNGLISQTYKNIELILINDGSTDKSLDICEKYSNVDDRIIVISQKNSGVSVSRNNGLAVASGDFITFADSDDLIEENAIEVMVEALMKSGADCIRTKCFLEKEGVLRKEPGLLEGGIYSGEDLDIIVEEVAYGKLPAYVWVLMFKKTLTKDLYFQTEIAMMEDTCFYVDLLKKVKSFEVSNLFTYLYKYNSNSASRSFDNILRNSTDILKVNDRFNKLLHDQINIRKMNAVHINIIINQLFTLYTAGSEYKKTMKQVLVKLKSDKNFLLLANNSDLSSLPLQLRITSLVALRHDFRLLIVVMRIRMIVKSLSRRLK